MENIDLRGSEIDTQSLKKLARENREHLKDVTLPNGCSDEQLETLLLYLPSLEKLTVRSPQGTGQWMQLLPRTMETLDISGLEARLEQWRPQEDLSGLKWLSFRGCSGVTDLTLACLPDLAPNLKDIIIGDCPDMTASGLLHVSRLTKLENLTLHGVPAGVTTDAGRDGPEDTVRWLQKLPESLQTLVISGPDGPEMEWNLKGDWGWPSATIRHATDSTLAFLTGLADRLEELTITESPLVTASGLLRVGRLTELENLTLHGVPAGSITDAVLDGLNNCSRLWSLQLGDKDQPPQETAITAAAVCRLAVACRELLVLCLHTTADSSQAVLDGLHRADLGRDSDGDPRTIDLRVPGSVLSLLRDPASGSLFSQLSDEERIYRMLRDPASGSLFSQLRRPPSGSRIRVIKWCGDDETVSSGCEQD